MRLKTTLTLGVASAAVAISVAQPANAACTTGVGTVTCSLPGETADDTETAIAGLAGDDVTLTVTAGGTIVQPDDNVIISAATKPGAVVVVNSGAIGADGAQVALVYGGNNTATNSFTATNNGTLFGSLFALGSGGDVVITNNGTIQDFIWAGSTWLPAPNFGNVTVVNEGVVEGSGIWGIEAWTAGEGKNATIEANGNVGTEADGWSNVTAIANGSEFVSTGPTLVGTVTSYSESTTNWGGEANVTVGADATVGNVVANGFAGASVTVDGSVGDADETHDVNVFSEGQDSTYQWTFDDTVAGYAYDESGTNVAAGGNGSVTVSEDGSVFGDVDIEANGDGTLDNAGFVGGNVWIDANGEDYSWAYGEDFASTTVGTVTTTTYGEDFSSTRTDVGGTGSLLNTGVIGDEDARVDIDVEGTAGVVAQNSGSIFGDSIEFSAGGSSLEYGWDYSETTVEDSATLASPDSYSWSYGEDGTLTAVVADATLTNDEDGVIDADSLGIYATGNAALDNAGFMHISGDGIDIEAGAEVGSMSFGEDYASTAAGYSFTETYDYSFGVEGGVASLNNSGLIGESDDDRNQIILYGAGGATVDNTGRINGDIDASAGGFNVSFGEDYGVKDLVATPFLDSYSWSYEAGEDTVAANTEFNNERGGLIVGSVDLAATGDVTVDNAGAVTGHLFSVTSGEDASYSASYGEDYAVNATSGDVTRTQTWSYGEDSTSTGGDIVGNYTGSVGNVQFAPLTGNDGDVLQDADGDSTANVTSTGWIQGDFTSYAGGSSWSDSAHASNVTVWTSDDLLVSETWTGGEDWSSALVEGDSTLNVNGGRIGTRDGLDGDDGNAYVWATGNAIVGIGNGGVVEGDLDVIGGGGYWNGGYSSSQTFSVTTLYDEDGDFASKNATVDWTWESTASNGGAQIDIAKGQVGEDVYGFGQLGGVQFNLGAQGEVGGYVDLESFAYGEDGSSSYTFAQGATGTPTGTGTWSSSWTSQGGDVTATVAGVIGNDLEGAQGFGDVTWTGGEDYLELRTNAGDATATVTGQVTGGMFVYAYGEDGQSTSTQTYTGAYLGDSYSGVDGPDYVDGTVTSESGEWSSTSVGGAAALTVDAANGNRPSNFGDIAVVGFTSSTLDISADSAVVQQTGYGEGYGYVTVGGIFQNFTGSSESDYVAATAQGTNTWTHVGGPATLTNHGQIGYDGGADFSGDGVYVYVASISDNTATVTNTGQIYGNVTLDSLAVDLVESWTAENIGDTTENRLTTRVYTPVGGTALLDNTGLISDWVEVRAENGTVNNNGVIRGTVYLGEDLNNYTTEQGDYFLEDGEEIVTIEHAPFVQTYTVNQNAFLGGGVNVGGAFGDLDPTIVTSTINATVNLNNGSVTTGNIVGEFDEETGERFTNTNVNLNGGGYLGLNDADANGKNWFGKPVANPLWKAFSAKDPQIAYYGDLEDYDGGSRVLGVNNLTKTGAGTFFIHGATYNPATNVNQFADYTLDVGTFAINGGEVQLSVDDYSDDSDGVFGIRGDVSNAATLVLGRRVDIPQQVFASNLVTTGFQGVDGVEIYQLGDFTQSATGTLVVGSEPGLVRIFNPSVGTGYSTNEPLGVNNGGVTLGYFTTPDVAYGDNDLADSFVTLDGNLDLAGKVQLLGPKGGIYLDGARQDIFSVSGTVDLTGTTVSGVDNNNFVTFGLAQRNEGDRKIVYVEADRAGYQTVATNENAVAAGTALTNSIGPVVTKLIADANQQGPFSSVSEFVLAQDMATIIAGFDTILTKDQVSRALNELASGDFYGSLMAIRTTDPFVDVVSNRRIPEGATGFNFWLQPSGDFYRLDGSEKVGSNDLDADNYGGSLGFGVANGRGEFGIGFGYGHIDASSDRQPVEADADTFMVGIYGRQAFGPLTVAADLVYGWSKWDASRSLPTLSRTATSEFDSKELRGDLRVEYAFPIGERSFIAPYGQVEFRNFKFDGFEEEGAGAIGLIVDKESKTVLTPTLGVKLGTAFDAGTNAVIRPEATLSYSFTGDMGAHRDVAYLGNPNERFRLKGVDPDGFFTGTLGLFADIGRNSGAFIRGGYSTGGDGNVASLKAGLVIGFGGSAEPAPVAPPAPPAPPPPPPPPPAPVVECNKGPYIVFFDWDKSDITPEAATVLDNAVTAYGNCDTVPIMLAGYADRSGTVQYNVGLSERRNGSVRNYLTARGIADAQISSQAFGESNPRVPTADGVRELQNRRVEITYGPGSGM